VTPFPDAHLAGETEARHFLLALAGMLGDGDELYRVLKQVLARCDDVELRAFCRQIQKAVERRA
jgi:hypothetical protein